MPATYTTSIDWDGDGGLTRLGDWDQWVFGGSAPGTLAVSTVRAHFGADSLLATWGVGGTLPQFGIYYDGLTVGVSYTLRGWVWVPTGSPNVCWAVAIAGFFSSFSTLKDQWQEIAVTFTATSAIHVFQIWPATSPAGGEQVWLDDPTIQIYGEDVSARVLDPPGFSTRYGRDRDRALSPMAAGEAAFQLDNRSRDYSPDNSSSPLVGKVKPGREVQRKATMSGLDYGMFLGHIDEFDVLPGIENQLAQISCLDPLARLRGIRISTPMYHGIRTGEAINIILDAAEWPAGKRDIDIGVSYLPWFWLFDAVAYDVLQQVVDSEGPPALATVDAEGNVVFRDRHHRLLRAASTTVQATFRDAGFEPMFSDPAVYDHGLRDIVNTVSFNVPLRKPAPHPTVMWSNSTHLRITDGEIRGIRVSSSKPFVDAITPVAGTDYKLLSGSVNVWLSADSGQLLTVFIQAVGGTALVDDLQLRAFELVTDATVQVFDFDAGSRKEHGRRYWPSPRDPVWASLPDVDAIADIILGHYVDRLPAIVITLRSVHHSSGTDVRLLQQLSRDLSDRVHIVEAQTGLDDDCFIETIGHSVGDLEHATVFGCEKAPDPVAGVFRFDTAGAGFDDGLFGLIGRTDPTTMFMFNVTGQGFDDGLFAY